MTNAFNNHIIRTQEHAGLLECQATTLCVCMAAILIPYRGHVRLACILHVADVRDHHMGNTPYITIPVWVDPINWSGRASGKLQKCHTYTMEREWFTFTPVWDIHNGL